MKRTLSSLLVVSTVLAVVATASAQDMQRGKGHSFPVFADCDLNGNGVIVADEFYEARAKRMAARAAEGGKMKNAANAPSFESIDLDGNGEINPEEFESHKARMIEKRQQRMQNRG